MSRRTHRRSARRTRRVAEHEEERRAAATDGPPACGRRESVARSTAQSAVPSVACLPTSHRQQLGRAGSQFFALVYFHALRVESAWIDRVTVFFVFFIP